MSGALYVSTNALPDLKVSLSQKHPEDTKTSEGIGTIHHGVKAVRSPLQTWCVPWERAVVFACDFFHKGRTVHFVALMKRYLP